MPASRAASRRPASTDDHRLTNDIYPVLKIVDGEIKRVDEPALTALNMRLRDDYTADCAKGVERWNKTIEKTGVNFRLELPHVAFHRQIGEFKNIQASPAGELLDDATWAKRKDQWLPSKDDGAFIEALMTAGQRAGQVRRLDFAAQDGHRQQAGRLRIREDRGVTIYPRPRWAAVQQAASPSGRCNRERADADASRRGGHVALHRAGSRA